MFRGTYIFNNLEASKWKKFKSDGLLVSSPSTIQEPHNTTFIRTTPEHAVEATDKLFYGGSVGLPALLDVFLREGNIPDRNPRLHSSVQLVHISEEKKTAALKLKRNRYRFIDNGGTGSQ